jgi:hypothetical protein
MKNAVFWDVTPCCSGNWRFGGMYRLHHQGDNNRRARKTLAVTSNRSTLRRNTLMMETGSSSETSALTRATLRNIQEDGILHQQTRPQNTATATQGTH